MVVPIVNACDWRCIEREQQTLCEQLYRVRSGTTLQHYGTTLPIMMDPVRNTFLILDFLTF